MLDKKLEHINLIGRELELTIIVHTFERIVANKAYNDEDLRNFIKELHNRLNWLRGKLKDI